MKTLSLIIAAVLSAGCANPQQGPVGPGLHHTVLGEIPTGGSRGGGR